MQKSEPTNQIELTAASLPGFRKWVGKVGVAENECNAWKGSEA